MTELQKAMDYAAKRTQAERNVKSHIDDILSEAAVDIARQARGISVVSSEAMFRQMLGIRTESIVDEAERKINAYIREYSKASIAALGDKDTGATGRLLNSELFGKTFQERSHTYMRYFLDDVVRMIVAGRKLKMRQAEIENTVRGQYQDPYTNGAIGQVNRKGADIRVPAYGRGVYHSAYGNIVRNAQGTISIAWGQEGRNHARRNGAVGFRVHRGSSYPCPLCDGEVDKGVRPITAPSAPFHSRCCCLIEYVYEN